MPYTVEAHGLCKTFGHHRALDGVDLAIEPGSAFALIGPNGAGKTTLVHILTTLERPDSGSATVAGHDVFTDQIGVKRSISLTGQFTAIDEKLTARENLEMVGQLLHLPRRLAGARTTELLSAFGLWEVRDRRTGTYSGGIKRRLDLAMAMVSRPVVLFLDEPTTGLDPRSREQVWGTVRSLVEDGVTILLTTQYLEEADQLADMVGVLDHGRVVARGTPDELKSRAGTEILRLQFADQDAYGRALGVLDAIEDDGRLRAIEIATDGSARDLYAVLGRLEAIGAPAWKVSVNRPSLDEVFLSMTDAAPGRSLSREAA